MTVCGWAALSRPRKIDGANKCLVLCAMRSTSKRSGRRSLRLNRSSPTSICRERCVVVRWLWCNAIYLEKFEIERQRSLPASIFPRRAASVPTAYHTRPGHHSYCDCRRSRSLRAVHRPPPRIPRGPLLIPSVVQTTLCRIAPRH